MSSSSAVVRLPSSSHQTLRLSRSAIGRPSVIAVVLLAVGVVTWWLSLSDIALGQMTDLGIGSVLPAGTWISFGLITAGFVLAWRFGSDALIVAGILATILVLFGLGVLGEPTLRLATTWRHVGITDYIATHGSVNPDIDAYFNWPGFFILSAFISKVAGLKNIEPIARAAPLFFNVMYLLPLVSIGRSLFTDRRVIWLGVWLFFINNWIGQDYYSPQGAGFFLYLVLIAVLLRWFKGMPRPTDSERRWWSRLGIAKLTSLPRALSRQAPIPADVPSTASQRVVLIVAIGMIVTVAVTSHQFTPPAMVASTAALSLIGWCRLRTLPVAILLVVLVWAAYMAVAYLAGNLHSLLGSVGAVTSNSNVGGRLNGSPGHQLIAQMRLFGTALLWIPAALGFLNAARARQLNLGCLVLALSAFPLLALQSYGGEVLLRIALFSMPFMALSAASLFVPASSEVAVSKTAHAALAGFCLLLIVLLPFNRYGNERMDYFPPAEITGVQAMYRLAPDGSYLYSADDSVPWQYEKYADYHYYNSLTGGSVQVNLDLKNPLALARAVAQFMTPPQGSGSRAFLIITSSTNAENDLFGPFQRGADLRLRRILSSSRYFRLLYHNPDAAVFELK